MNEARVLSEEEIAEAFSLYEVAHFDGNTEELSGLEFAQPIAKAVDTIPDLISTIRDLQMKLVISDNAANGQLVKALADRDKQIAELEQKNTTMRGVLDDIAYSQTGVDVEFRALEFRQKARQALAKLSGGAE